jgi:hypothetical protein
MVDVSEGGVRIELNVNPEDLNLCTETNQLKILGYSVESLPVPLTKDTIKMAWQDDQLLGCYFVAA